ncbi:DUF2147 domain-containing protein [Hirschia maritima]|uniref:DUF2147 domain-containing protein n=1 Tax=Hirschia maritima TaxID=1121961 RepID=UPI00035D3C42|nr:DUF2147 domain-containing protein [Hirschia maritima]
MRDFLASLPPPIKALAFFGCLSVLTSCATPQKQAELTPELRPFEGYWRLHDEIGTIQISTCEKDNQKICGQLIQFQGKTNDRDFSNPDFWAWGQKVCGSQILHDLQYNQRSKTLTGFVYIREKGKVFNIEAWPRHTGRLEVLIYEGTSINESVDIAINAALGNLPDMLSSADYLFRLTAGKEITGELAHWKKVISPLDRCDTPQREKWKINK